MTPQQKHRAYQLIREKDLSACFAYLKGVDLRPQIRQEVTQLEAQYQALLAQTNVTDPQQALALELDKDFYLRSLEALLQQRRTPSVWVLRGQQLWAWGRVHWQILLLQIFLVAGVVLVALYGFGALDGPQELTIYVRDTHNNPALVDVAKLNITATQSHQPHSRRIEEQGMVDFSEVSTRLAGDSISVGLQFDQPHKNLQKLWHIIGPNRFLYQGQPITLLVDKTETWGRIQGRVLEAGSLDPIAGASIQIDNCNKMRYFSDSSGNFDFVLPRACWLNELNVGYRINVRKDGYQSYDEVAYDPRSSALDFRLSK